MFKKKETDLITVPAKTRNRARKALATGSPSVWVDQALYLVGQNMTHHRHGDPLLDEAVQAAETLLALLVELRDQEQR